VSASPQNQVGAQDQVVVAERIFLCTEGEASKFWRVRVERTVQTVRYGRIGTEGHELTKTLEGPVAARKATQKLIAEKLGKGYREVSEQEATAAHDAARADMGETTMTTSSAPRRPRRAGKPQNALGQQLLLSFGEEEGIEAPGWDNGRVRHKLATRIVDGLMVRE
jgi:predicted DNA-binding WGR domain protein